MILYVSGEEDALMVFVFGRHILGGWVVDLLPLHCRCRVLLPHWLVVSSRDTMSCRALLCGRDNRQASLHRHRRLLLPRWIIMGRRSGVP